MDEKKFKYIYGPVPSWRLGSSLGIDPISDYKEKICSFDCVYCQIGKTTILTKKRKIFVPAEMMIRELKALPPVKIDYITFSGRGEPALAANLGEMIREVKKVRKEPVAVLTNASLFYDEKVREDLCEADLVVAKLDAASEDVFRKVNSPAEGISLLRVLEGLKLFRKEYKGKLALQCMFMKENKNQNRKIAELAEKIEADEVEINTPLRPSRAEPLSKSDIENIAKNFKGLNVISVYRGKHDNVKPVSRKDTLTRRGKI